MSYIPYAILPILATKLFHNLKLHIFIPLTHFTLPSIHMATDHLFSAFMSLFLFCLFGFSDSTYKWNHVVEGI